VTPVEARGAAPVRFAVALTISPQEGYRLYGDLAEALGEKVGRPVHLILRRTFSEVSDLMRSRQADIAHLCSRGYLQGRADFSLTALALPLVKATRSHPSYVIVSAESEITSPVQLEGKSFAFADPLCAPGPFPAGLGARHLEAFFKRTLVVTGHDRAIRAVAEGLVDGALVDGPVYTRLALSDSRQIGKTRVIGKTVPYMNSPMAVHPEVDPSLREALRQALIALHEGERGRAALSRLGIERFVLPADGAAKREE
jgi:phosphonate transport system substrate-binding protein